MCDGTTVAAVDVQVVGGVVSPGALRGENLVRGLGTGADGQFRLVGASIVADGVASPAGVLTLQQGQDRPIMYIPHSPQRNGARYPINLKLNTNSILTWGSSSGFSSYTGTLRVVLWGTCDNN